MATSGGAGAGRGPAAAQGPAAPCGGQARPHPDVGLGRTVADLLRSVGRRPYLIGRGLVERCIDARFGIRAESRDPGVKPPGCADGVPYMPSPWSMVSATLRELAPGPDDTVFDIGCGKGRVVVAFARLEVRRVVGVEIDPALARCAEANVAGMRGRRSPAEIRCENAAETDYDGGTIYFLFNPFGAATLRSVLGRIRDSVRRHPRRIRIVYHLSMHDAVVREAGWLTVEQREWKRWLRKPWRAVFAESLP